MAGLRQRHSFIQFLISPKNMRNKRGFLKEMLFTAILCAVLVGVFEWFGGFLMDLFNKDYRKARAVMMGAVDFRDDSGIHFGQNTIAKPYLLYIASPNYISENGIPQHNEHGYRGPLVPLERRAGTVRLLFMGGSTTYSSGVLDPQQSYPFQAKRILADQSPQDVQDIEIINAGLPWGSTAEIVTHYHFKYHYYRPDLVVINTGGNDAQPNLRSNYQPDYSHWRKTMRNIEPLPVHGRWIMKSKLISFVVLHIFAYDRLAGQHFNLSRRTLNDPPPPGSWYPKLPLDAKNIPVIPQEHLAFEHNLRCVIREILDDGAKIVLMPFRPNPNSEFYDQNSLDQIERHQHVLERLAHEFGLGFAPFPAETISTENWVDFCHVNEAGCLEKAKHVAPIVKSQLWPQG